MFWDQRYSEPGYAYGTAANDFLLEHLASLEGPALTLGEGEGRNAVAMAARGLAVTAVDSSDVGLRKARELAAERGVALETVTADLADFDMGEGRWRTIVSIWCHLPPDLRRDVLGRAVRALEPGGTLVLEAYGPGQLELSTGGPRDLALLPGLDVLLDDLRGLVPVVAVETRRMVHEGRYHDGESAVVQIVAKKR